VTKYVLWDIPTSTLLLETECVREIQQSIDIFSRDNGDTILAELLLGIEDPATDAVQSFTGKDIASELNRRIPGRDQSSLKRTA